MNKLKNRVQLIGFLGSDPELKSLESGNTLAKFSSATNETYLNAQGEKVTNTTWHSLVVWNKLAELCGKVLKKGSEVVVEGSLFTGIMKTLTVKVKPKRLKTSNPMMSLHLQNPYNPFLKAITGNGSCFFFNSKY